MKNRSNNYLKKKIVISMNPIEFDLLICGFIL
jgi:hypothetical protein